MYASLGRYITAVRLAVSDLTDGAIDFDDLPDAHDLAEMREDGLSPREAAREILTDECFFSFEFTLEDADVGYDCEGRPIGG